MTKFLAILVFFSLSIIGCSSCEPENIYKPDYSNGYAQGTLNNKEWKGEGKGFKGGSGRGYDIAFRVRNTAGNTVEEIVLIQVPTDIGEYNLYQESGTTNDTITGCYYYIIIDGDAIGDSYFVDEDDDSNVIEIIDYDESNGILSGAIRASHYVVKPKRYSIHPDSVFLDLPEFEIYLK